MPGFSSVRSRLARDVPVLDEYDAVGRQSSRAASTTAFRTSAEDSRAVASSSGVLARRSVARTDAAIQPGWPVIVVTDGPARPSVEEVVAPLKERGARVITVSDVAAVRAARIRGAARPRVPMTTRHRRDPGQSRMQLAVAGSTSAVRAGCAVTLTRSSCGSTGPASGCPAHPRAQLDELEALRERVERYASRWYAARLVPAASPIARRAHRARAGTLVLASRGAYERRASWRSGRRGGARRVSSRQPSWRSAVRCVNGSA